MSDPRSLPPSRRLLIGGAMALAACDGRAETTQALPANAALKALSSAPLGVCLASDQIAEPVIVDLLLRHFDQVTPEWEMKMEAVLKEDGGFDFSLPDRIAGFAKAQGLGLHGHALIWYAQDAPAFKPLEGKGKAFADAYRNYILAVAGRYRGGVRGWDVVNEPISEEGGGYRDCTWRKNLGMDYVRLAFEHAREADPAAVLFLNDYNLEAKPAKLDTFLRLTESLLKGGAPLGGLGTQTHVSADSPRGEIARSIKALASFGLPIHISEVDVSTRQLRSRLPRPDVLGDQSRVVEEIAQAFFDLPQRQRYALTFWGLRDRDSWLRRPPYADGDKPLLFDDAGRPKPAFEALGRTLVARPA